MQLVTTENILRVRLGSAAPTERNTEVLEAVNASINLLNEWTIVGTINCFVSYVGLV